MKRESSRIVHYTRCTGARFTADQWKDISPRDVAFEYHGFQFNYCDICLNPRILFDWKSKKSYDYVQIRVAESPAGWSYATSSWIGHSGHTSGVGFVKKHDRRRYNTVEEAFEAAVRELCEQRDYAIKDAERNIDNNDDDEDSKLYRKFGATLRQTISVIDRLEAEIRQPSLFGYF